MSPMENLSTTSPAAKNMEQEAEVQTHKQRDSIWQKRVLPLMATVLVGLAIFFIVISTLQTREIQTHVAKIDNLDMEKALEVIMLRHQKAGSKLNEDQMRWEALAVLEAQALNRRYTHARILLTESIWTRFLGFITGMILSLIGAAFVLGKLREDRSNVNAGSKFFNFSLDTASPGLMLAMLGTALMLSTILVKHEITVNDGIAYLQSVSTTNHASVPAFPTPPPLPPALPGEEDAAAKATIRNPPPPNQEGAKSVPKKPE